MKKIIPIMFVLGILLMQINVPVSAQKVEAVSEERDLGWITYANSTVTVERLIPASNTTMGFDGNIYVYNSWDFAIVCGASLPINLTLLYPEEFTPGENLTIYILIESLPGYIFFNTSGHHKLNITLDVDINTMGGVWQPIDMALDMALLLENQYSTRFSANIETPIGEENKTLKGEVAHSGAMSLALSIDAKMMQPISKNISRELIVDSSIAVNIAFDINIVAKTRIIGHVIANGTALSYPINTTIEWTSEGLKNLELPIKPNASADDTLNINIDLEYIVDEFYIEFSNITLITDIDIEEIGKAASKVFGSIITDIEAVMESIIEGILSHYNGSFMMNITSIGESKPIKTTNIKVRGSSGNTLKSECPYGETSLLSQSISIVGPEAQKYNIGTITYIIVAVVVGGIALTYVVLRKNRK